MLSADELRRRFTAARVLRGLSQRELGLLFEQDGLGRSDPGRIERGTMALDRARREAASRHLGVPERWFTADTVDEIVGNAEPPTPSAEQAAEQLAAAALEAAQEILRGRAQGGAAPGPPGRSEGSPGAGR